ncbi:MAG: putative prophage MuMc02, nuclease [Verrucomicrobiaceae bacterium]|nr:putative prophage MuMc02, nuclease [Verrucomicrobiaceae bacterium]
MLLVCTACTPATAPATSVPARHQKGIAGKVVSVHDGDTLTLQSGGRGSKKLKVRLEGIDAPEIGQPYGDVSRQALNNMVYGRMVTIVPVTVDKYGRTVGRVVLGRLDVNGEMVRIGLAWWYDRYSQDAGLSQAQQQARYYHWGLWRDENPTPPWTWRNIHPRR